jgi:hypothetical protein
MTQNKRYRILKEPNYTIPKFTLQSQAIEIKEGKLNWGLFENTSKPKHILAESDIEEKLTAQKIFGKHIIHTKK